MDAQPLTLMAVHAHPDDESSSTGGILARYADEGVRTVLVTCTNGELGDAPGGVKPGQPGHVEEEVVAIRGRELAASCRLLGVRHLERLGYRDSGMMGWATNDHPESFWRTPLEAPAQRLAELMRAYRPQVVVTYDANGFYGHPDHIQAHRVTMAAAELSGVPDKVYFATMPKSVVARMAELVARQRAASGTTEGEEPEPLPDIGTEDHLVDAVVDCRAVVDRKYASLAAHASQVDNAFFLDLGTDGFGDLFGREAFVRARDRTNAALPEEDLFAGLR